MLEDWPYHCKGGVFPLTVFGDDDRLTSTMFCMMIAEYPCLAGKSLPLCIVLAINVAEMSFPAAMAVAAQTSQVGEFRVVQDNVEPNPFRAAEQTNRPSRKHAAMAGLLILVGVASAGLMLLALVVIWGRRVRRMTRKTLPKHSQVDDLWYLRPSKQTLASEDEQQIDADAETK